MPTFRQDFRIGTKVPLIKGDDIADGAVTKEKISKECLDYLTSANFAKILDEDIDKLAPLDKDTGTLTITPLNGLLAQLNEIDVPDKGTYAIAIDAGHAVTLDLSEAMPESEVKRILGI